jgi:hypothetical protein
MKPGVLELVMIVAALLIAPAIMSGSLGADLLASFYSNTATFGLGIAISVLASAAYLLTRSRNATES